MIILGLEWPAFFPLFAGSMVALGYSAILHYLILEAGMRPVLIDINNSETAPRLTAPISAIPLRVRLMAALPLINLITGLVVAALTSVRRRRRGSGRRRAGRGGGGDHDLARAHRPVLEVDPAPDRRPAAGDRGDRARAATTSAVPVTTGDELGELAASFNQMVEGLAERERLREAFGTYLDKSVAEYILSEGFCEEGEEVEVSILFCDVRDFTELRLAGRREGGRRAAERAVRAVVVPIVDRHGGHVDKFVGDGLLAVFGAPEPFPDHADRAVRAACEMATGVNSDDEPEPADRRRGEHAARWSPGRSAARAGSTSA